MKICKAILFGAFVMLISCRSEGESVEVFLSDMGNFMVHIKIKNGMDESYLFYKYNMCPAGILFQNLFEVSSNSQGESVGYSGPVDYVNEGEETTEDSYIVLEAGEVLECEIDLRMFYVLTRERSINVQYKAVNPQVGDQKRYPLVSNTIVMHQGDLEK